MEDESIHELPPSKRFRLLYQQQESLKPLKPHHSHEFLPAKKRTDFHLLHPVLPPTSICLPAKKRVWAPPSLSPTKPHQDHDNKPNSPESPPPPAIESAAGKEEEEDDDGVVCAVCGSTDGNPQDPIVFCDGCDLMVHPSCYGNPLISSIPDGDWFCLRCERGKEKGEAECCLCPAKGGAVKPTIDGGWAHILCALFVPEVFFQDPAGRDGVNCSRVPCRRWEERCYLCSTKRGCAIECSQPKCGLGFHVSCGLEEGLWIEYREGNGGEGGSAIVAGFCMDHTQLWRKQQLTGKYKIVPREHDPKGKMRN